MSHTHTARRNRWRALAVGSAAAMTITMLGTAPALADDGQLVRKSMSHEGNPSVDSRGLRQ